MKIFDMHIHARNVKPTPKDLISALNKAGIYGGCVFSSPPIEQKMEEDYNGTLSFDERVSEVLSWCEGAEGRLFPVLWVHPDEENILENVERAAKAGIVAFKMICNDYYIYEEKPMALLRRIASLGKPVFFHSGILWDGEVSSAYNRPMNWEALLDIDGIRFSMGHCSWPWVDECVALYGKLLQARSLGKNVEMFYDLTPGTPKLYRKELFEKLYTLGYNVGDHTMIGFDGFADGYNPAWTADWLCFDGAIMDELGISLENREKLYEKNLLRFLGKSADTVALEPPAQDDAHPWSPVNPEVALIAEKWYKRLGFPKEYDEAFYRALKAVPVSDAVTVEGYNKFSEDGKRNLITYLYLCEKTKEKYEAMGLPEEVLDATLSDLVRWTNEWTVVKGELFLGELSWLARHMSASIFRIGRLQYCKGRAESDVPSIGVKKGDPIVEVHIPKGGRMTAEAAKESLMLARAFFKKHFPDYDYKCFTMHSWLLDDTLKKYLPAESGILQLASLFEPVEKTPSYALLKYIFAWDTTPLNLRYRYPVTSLAAAVQKAVLAGETFYEVLGVIRK
jgi:predicted TIM-barrel fold metal-dependent hydrolase